MTALAQLSRAVQLLAEARTLEDITHVHSMASAAEQYAKAERLGDEAERHAREIRLRAARKAGEALADLKARGELAGRGDVRHMLAARNLLERDEKIGRLADHGISANQSSRWQRLASLPEGDFEKAVASGRGENAISRGTHRLPKSEHGRRTSTIKQSLRGLQQAAVQIQSLAEALDGQMLGDWSRLYDLDEAQTSFDVIESSLPIMNARLKRALRERRGHGTASVG